MTRPSQMDFEETKQMLRTPNCNPLKSLILLPLVAVLVGCAANKVMLIPVAEQETQDGAIDASMVEQPPVVEHRVLPEYPKRMIQHRISDEVLMSVIVSTNGEVRDVRVIQSADESFATSARNAVLKWRFQPAMSKGQKVDCRIRLPIEFHAMPK